MADDNYNTSQSNLNTENVGRHQPGGQQQHPIRTDSLQGLNEELTAARQPSETRTTRIADEMSQDLQYLSRDAPLDGGESTFGAYSTLSGTNQQPGGASPTNATTTQQRMFTSTITRATSEGLELENDYERTDFRLDADDQTPYEHQTRATRQQMSEPPALEQLAPDNVDIQRPMQQAG